MRGYNVGLLSGDIEIDGAHQSGRRAAEKRGRPQGKIAVAPVGAAPAPNAAALTGTSKVKARLDQL